MDYSPAQRVQLEKQSYLPTQALTAAVWAPGEMPRFGSCLKSQLHRNFYLVNCLEELQDAYFDCLIVLTEDASVMSTSLGYFADAVARGRDFVFSDCCFGPTGETNCYFPNDGGCRNVRLAAISPALFRSLNFPADASAEQVIARAQESAQAPERIAQLLAWYHRGVRAEDLFCRNTSRALLYAHEFSVTGAPLVLLSAAPELKKQGYSIAAACPAEGQLLEQYLQNGIAVAVDPKADQGDGLTDLAPQADFVLANTISEYSVVVELARRGIPAIWWLHDAENIYPWLQDRLPRLLSGISVYGVSEYARRLYLKYYPGSSAGILTYGLEDSAVLPSEPFPVEHHGKRLFVTIGSLESRKGFDVLCDAIGQLPDAARAQCMFLIVGRPIHEKSAAMVRNLAKKYPEEVRYVEYIPRTHINSVFRQADCVVCSSRDDPLPTFVTEGWMHGVPCICSENTGSAALIEDGQNGFVYGGNDPAELANQIQNFLHLDTAAIKTMQKASRETYEKHFTMDIFNQNIRKIIEQTKK